MCIEALSIVVSEGVTCLGMTAAGEVTMDIVQRLIDHLTHVPLDMLAGDGIG